MSMPIGKVLHYYEKNKQVAIEIINHHLQTGDRVSINGHETIIDAIKIGSEQVARVAPGDACVIKIPTPAVGGDILFLI